MQWEGDGQSEGSPSGRTAARWAGGTAREELGAGAGGAAQAGMKSEFFRDDGASHAEVEIREHVSEEGLFTQ